MKAIITANQGGSRYQVGVKSDDSLIQKQQEEAQVAYEMAEKAEMAALRALQEAQAPYLEAVNAVKIAVNDYVVCMNDWDFDEYYQVLAAPCHDKRYDARIACLEGEPEQAVECLARVDAEWEGCLGQAEADAKAAEGAYYADCQKTHGPIVAKAQAAATALLPGVQDAMLEHHHCVARKLSAARRYNEMAALAALTLSYTVWSAQWNEEIPVGEEVLLAQTPAGRHVITALGDLQNCWHISRTFPAFNLFVNAALAPGAETWLPTWRTGSVLAIEGVELKVEVHPGTFAGGLGTLYSVNPINCTPSQAHFDGTAATGEARIKAARAALVEAQNALADALQARADCIQQYDQNWANFQYDAKADACKTEWDIWLANCQMGG